MDLSRDNFVTPTQQVELLEARGRLQRAIGRFRGVQQVYTPVSLSLLASHESLNPDRAINPENLPLLLPSGIPPAHRQSVSLLPFVEMETEYRRAQLRSSLDGIRTLLFVRTRLHTQRTLHIRNQQASTRARQVLARNDRKLDPFKVKYRAAWSAVKELVGEVHIGYRELHDADVRSLDELDTHASGNMRKTLGKRARNAQDSTATQQGNTVIQPGESRRTLSWIWTGVDTSEDSEAMREATRVEWSKSWARKRRWDEELALLGEEMRRTVLSLRFESTTWKSRTMASEDAISEGMAAYATRQASIRDALASKFEALWALPDVKPRRYKLDIDILDAAPLPHNSDDDEDNGDNGRGAIG